MDDLNVLFRNRIGYPPDEPLTFEDLDTVLEKMAMSIPFENVRLIEGRTSQLTEANLIDKIVGCQEGGLCYELNPLLYLFLKENNFDVSMVRGVVYDAASQEWSATGRTHVAVLLSYEGETYLLDAGFGGNLPLKPVPLDGDSVNSATGQFRVERFETEWGDYLFYLKLNHKDKDWRIGYAFNTRSPVWAIEELEEVQKAITEHPASAFNKRALITRLTESGNVTLADGTFTEWKKGRVEKKEIDEEAFLRIKTETFKM